MKAVVKRFNLKANLTHARILTRFELGKGKNGNSVDSGGNGEKTVVLPIGNRTFAETFALSKFLFYFDNCFIKTQKEMAQFFKSINIKLVKDSELDNLYKGHMKKIESGIDAGKEGLDFATLKKLYGEMLIPKQIKYLFQKTDKGMDEKLSVQEFREFLLDEQKDKIIYFNGAHMDVLDDANLQEIMKYYSPNGDGLEKAGFTQFLRDHATIVSRKHHMLHQDTGLEIVGSDCLNSPIMIAITKRV